MMRVNGISRRSPWPPAERSRRAFVGMAERFASHHHLEPSASNSSHVHHQAGTDKHQVAGNLVRLQAE